MKHVVDLEERKKDEKWVGALLGKLPFLRGEEGRAEWTTAWDTICRKFPNASTKREWWDRDVVRGLACHAFSGVAEWILDACPNSTNMEESLHAKVSYSYSAISATTYCTSFHHH